MCRDTASSTLNWSLAFIQQVAYEAIASLLQVQFAWAVYITFPTIVANYNEPLAAAQAHIHMAERIKCCRKQLALYSIGLHQDAFETAASPLQV